MTRRSRTEEWRSRTVTRWCRVVTWKSRTVTWGSRALTRKSRTRTRTRIRIRMSRTEIWRSTVGQWEKASVEHRALGVSLRAVSCGKGKLGLV